MSQGRRLGYKAALALMNTNFLSIQAYFNKEIKTVIHSYIDVRKATEVLEI